MMMMMGVSFSPQCSNAAHTYVWSYYYDYISHSQFLLHHTFYDTHCTTWSYNLHGQPT